MAGAGRDWREDLAAELAARAGRHVGPLVVGLCGPQGSGKSTAATIIRRRLIDAGRSCAVLSIDDLYMTREERKALAREIHPLLATRGPPGTHDVGLGVQVIEAINRAGEVRLPRFDKALDDRAPAESWPIVHAPVDCLVLEGWCVGARPQSAEDLAAPINALEGDEDADGRWRRWINDQLAGPYQTLFGTIDYLALIRAPGFEQVLAWRTEQENELRQVADGPGVMSEPQLARFVQHYERISRWIEVEMPARADWIVDLNPDRSGRSVTRR